MNSEYQARGAFKLPSSADLDSVGYVKFHEILKHDVLNKDITFEIWHFWELPLGLDHIL